jgi:deoxyribodipyrimidine photo-lyase
MAFLLDGLSALQTALHEAGGRLLFYPGKPESVLPKIVEETGASAVYCNKDYTPYACKRDDHVGDALSVEFHSFDDAVVMPPGSVMTNKGDPYTVYTPFKKKWREQSKQHQWAVETELPGNLYQIRSVESDHLPTLSDLGFDASVQPPPAGETVAQKRLDAFLHGPVYHYNETRNELALHPFEGTAGTSQLSPYFRLGMLSPRQAVSEARAAYKRARTTESHESVTTWVDELIWREFYMHIMAHFPHVYSGNFRSDYDDLEWEDNDDALEAWKRGETGYPIVDAAMRQLSQTGWMPNRARMIVASFLTKDLLIDWREGERYFMQQLVDGDPAANNGGWQWAAGTGTDAQPYFRIFNPTSQSQKFDPDGVYIREWVPELADLNSKEVHQPWTLENPPQNYPAPIVDHKKARQRTLDAFKRARGETA